MFDTIHWFFQLERGKYVGFFNTLCWMAWHERNIVVHGDQARDPQIMDVVTVAYLCSFLKVHRCYGGNCMPKEVKWHSPLSTCNQN